MRNSGMRGSGGGRQPDSRTAFTLIEMLVAVGILLILSVTAVTLFNVSVDGDRIRSSARQIQSYCEGARDRAILSQEPRGVRFLIDPNGPPNAVTVRSMIFIGAPEKITGQFIIGSEADTNGNMMLDPNEDLNGNGTRDDGVLLLQPQTTAVPPLQYELPLPNEVWDILALKGRLLPGARIRLFQTSGSKGESHVVDALSFTGTGALLNSNTLVLSRAPDFFNSTDFGKVFDFELELAPSVLANQEPVELGRNISINLDISRSLGKLPSSWRNGAAYANQLDIMFSPRGTVMGPAAASGLIHFYLADTTDIENGIRAGVLSEDLDGDEVLDTGEDTNESFNLTTGNFDPTPNGKIDIREGEELVVTLFTRTGHVSTHPVDTTDSNNDGRPDDLFRFAETGEVAP